MQLLSWSSAVVVVLGLIAGVLGGMLGVGGSVLMIPGLVWLFGQDRDPALGQHVYQAAAMIANVAVSVPAALRHRKAGTMRHEVLRWMLPAALGFVLLGVWMSNWPVFEGKTGGIWLGRLMGVFLFYVAYENVRKLRSQPSANVEELGAERIRPGVCVGLGFVMGMFAGLLGIGGGALAVPLQQMLMRLPLRQCIANSSAVICVIAAVGAVYKNATLGLHHYDWHTSLWLALLLAPAAWIGGRFGANLTHRLPLRQVRMVFIALMLVSAWKMLKLPWP